MAFDSTAFAHLQRRMRTGFILQGALAALMGVVLIVFPFASVKAFAIVFGAWLIASGILSIVGRLLSRRSAARGSGGLPAVGGQMSFIGAAVVIVAGLIVFLMPEAAVLAVSLFVAFWALILGGFAVLGALSLRRLGSRTWIGMLIAGLCGLGLGVLVIARPDAGVIGVLWAIGAFAILIGAAFIAFGIRIGRFDPAQVGGFPSAGAGSGGGYPGRGSGRGGQTVEGTVVDPDDTAGPGSRTHRPDTDNPKELP